MKKILLSRDEFRQKVGERDSFRCVVCQNPAVDVHHIMERRLFDDGGYYIHNGVSLCAECHIKAEQTIYSREFLRLKASIGVTILPDDFGYDETYDKWGNPILPNGMRVRGELFYDESVQKILSSANILDIFTTYVKYPKTKHCPWSQGQTSCDKTYTMEELFDRFCGRRVVVTEKMDGENSSLYPDMVHARSIDGRNHPSRNWLKNFHSQISHNIPPAWRICGENLFAKHSIWYKNLPSYFLAFSIFNDQNTCLSWDDFVEWCSLIGIDYAPVLYRGVFDIDAIKSCYTGKSTFSGSDCQEGYVVRLEDEIPFTNYKNSICKFVRQNHVQSNANWMFQEIVKNELVT